MGGKSLEYYDLELDEFLNKPDALLLLSTVQLLAVRDACNIQKSAGIDLYHDLHIMVKEILATREHVPNKL